MFGTAKKRSKASFELLRMVGRCRGFLFLARQLELRGSYCLPEQVLQVWLLLDVGSNRSPPPFGVLLHHHTAGQISAALHPFTPLHHTYCRLTDRTCSPGLHRHQPRSVRHRQPHHRRQPPRQHHGHHLGDDHGLGRLQVRPWPRARRPRPPIAAARSAIASGR